MTIGKKSSDNVLMLPVEIELDIFSWKTYGVCKGRIVKSYNRRPNIEEVLVTSIFILF